MGITGSRKVRAGTVIVALLALAAVLALGPAATSSAAPAAAAAAPAENAVIYWSGVASSVIVIGRAPQARACSARWCMARCTTPLRRSTAS